MKQAFLPLAALLLAAPAAFADLKAPLLTLNTSDLMLAAVQDPPSPDGETPAKASTAALFGEGPGSSQAWFITLGGSFAKDSDPGTHINAFVTLSTFVARELEFQIELSGWHFEQPGDNTLGAGLAINLRWHFLHGNWGGGTDGFDWSLFGEAGIGIILSGDDVPVGGTDLNLSPRFGAGGTLRLGDSEARLVVGFRWHHMSNARVFGDDNNPDFNAPMIYAGVQWPF